MLDEYISFNKVFRSRCLAALCVFSPILVGKTANQQRRGRWWGRGLTRWPLLPIR